MDCVIKPLTEQDLVKGQPGVSFENTIELVMADGAGARDFLKGQFRGSPGGLGADQRPGAFGDECVPPGGMAEVLSEPLGSLSGTKAMRYQPKQVGMDEGCVPKFSSVVFLNDRLYTGVHLNLVHGPELERTRFRGVQQTQQNGYFAVDGQFAHVQAIVAGFGHAEIERQT